MKTFKLVGLELKKQSGEEVTIDIIDALVINQENESNTWLMECFVKREFLPHFLSFGGNEFSVRATITKRDNEPAYFRMKVVAAEEMDDFASILMEGNMSYSRGHHSEKLLADLIEKGLSGDDLLAAFKAKNRS
ncbi:YwpF family protein [Bacillus kwashiorkori]|uniref:YwpF family protein n=1 Tax=Bacillus kwashiorkori TaxID=1522318 RepID=UPI0007852D84|nr:YwpF family protein [Bacillus kwashiorkori]